MAVVLLDFLLLVSFWQLVQNVIVVDKVGILNEENDQLPPHHAEIAKVTNRDHLSGDLQTALKGADIFIGVSAPGALKKEWIAEMGDKPVIFAMANPVPEIFPDEALAGGAYIIGTDAVIFLIKSTMCWLFLVFSVEL